MRYVILLVALVVCGCQSKAGLPPPNCWYTQYSGYMCAQQWHPVGPSSQGTFDEPRK